jgi:phosphate transport system substrate-binding protein
MNALEPNASGGFRARSRLAPRPGRWVLGLVTVVLLLAPRGSAGADTPIVVQGSGYTMPVFTVPWAESFSASSGTGVEIRTSGTSTGPPALLRGEADIASMTRPMNEAEVEALRRKYGSEPVAIPVAGDALVVFVNEANPLAMLTLPQVDAIFSRSRRCGADASIERWGQLGLEGEWADRSLALHGRRPGSGTGTYFADVALCKGYFKPWVRVSPGTDATLLAVRESRWAIAYGSRREAGPGTRIVPIAPRDVDPATLPEAMAVYSGGYPLGRLLYLYVMPENVRPWPDGLRAFLQYTLGEEAQQEVEAAGYLTVPAPLREATLQRLGP